jgi:hypothetical protein
MSAYKVGDRVEFARDGSAGCNVIGCVGTIIEVSESDEEGTQYLVKIDGWVAPRWSDRTEFHENCVYHDENIDPSPTPPESRQDALNRLLAERKERKAALDGTVKAIQALIPSGTLVRYKWDGQVYRIKSVKKSLWISLRRVDGHYLTRFTTFSQVELIDKSVSGGDTP